MAYQMKGNKQPGSSYKNGGPGKGFESKGLTGTEVTYDEDGNAINPDTPISELTKGTTVLPEATITPKGSYEVGDAISRLKSYKKEVSFGPTSRYSTQLTTSPMSYSKYLEDRPNNPKELQSYSKYLEELEPRNRPTSSTALRERLKTHRPQGERQSRERSYSHGEIHRTRQQKMDAGNLSNIAKQSSEFLTDPTYTLKKKSGKEKIISKKRYDKLSAKFEKKKAKGKTPKRSVSDASIVERIMK